MEGSVAWLQTPAAAQQTAEHLAPGLSADKYLLCNYITYLITFDIIHYGGSNIIILIATSVGNTTHTG